MSQPTRKVPVKILHLAMPRTGSVSMMEAYKILGYTKYHGFDYIDPSRRHNLPKWEAAIDAKFYEKGRPYTKEDFDQDDFLGEFEVLSDFPCLAFTEEFLEWYPDAKVILVHRDMEKWYHSFDSQLISALETPMAWLLLNVFEPWCLSMRPATTMRKMQYAMFDCRDQAGFRANARDTYRRHYAFVKSRVDAGRLLEYRLGSGWEPLCGFLGREVPACAFPFKNESREFAIWMRGVQMRELRRGLETVVKGLVLPGLVVLVAWMVL